MSGVAVAVDECEIRLSALKVLFYAGMLTIAMIIDRGHSLDLDKLIVGLQNESELISRQARYACFRS